MEKAIGYISYTHGLDGKVKVVPMVDSDAFRQYITEQKVRIKGENDDAEMVFYKIDIFAFNGKSFICRIDGINHINDAKKLTKKEIKIEIENNTILNAENLVGFDVFIEDKKAEDEQYGKVIDYGNYGAGDLLEIKTLQGKSNFVLCNKENICKVYYDDKRIFLKKEIIF